MTNKTDDTKSKYFEEEDKLLVVANWALEWGRAGFGMWAGWRGGTLSRGAERAPGRPGAEPRGVRGRLGPAEQDLELPLETGMWEPEQRQRKEQSQGRGSGECLLRKERGHLRARMGSLNAPRKECRERSPSGTMGG